MIRNASIVVLSLAAYAALVLWPFSYDRINTIFKRDYDDRGRRISTHQTGTIAPNWGT